MKNRNFVNLTVNPCKMCMPMGAVMAFKGIEGNMVILHGSQGCSTYIRRHMATHYNEPIDIASSSLTENGTVYGGADNLKTGLKNMIKMYNPTSIGVMTTCLAETIGEDINMIISEFYEEEREIVKNIKIVTVPTPGYGGTQAEGYYRAVRKITEQLAVKTEKNNKINIICANLNPGDVRSIKNILKCFGVEYVMLPDVSNTLDAPHGSRYSRIPEGGTKLKDIESMAGAAATVEMGITIENEQSAGVYLKEKFGVPLYKCGIPVGLRNNDEFINLISKISGKDIPDELKQQRGRYLDAMIDNHKYNGEAKAVLYGDPELVLAVSKICSENGIQIKLAALGTENRKLKDALKKELSWQTEDAVIIDDTDFETIEAYAKDLKVNIMIGNSDGRRMAERLNLQIVRIGFPVHDRAGAQRKFITGYEGSAFFIDEVANVVLAEKEHNFRKYAYDNFYTGNNERKKDMEIKSKTIEEKTRMHPCYGDNAHKYARMHIPVAPKCNISCNYCSRKYDCANESRPGVTSEILTPEQALIKFKEVKNKIPNLTVLGIAGPGDALANFEEVKKSVELIKAEDPNITFCLSTNGLMLPFYANELVGLGVSHITVTINCVDKKIGAKIYREVNYLGNKYTGEQAAEILINNQLAGLKYLCSKGVVCKVNTVMIKGINDKHVEKVAEKVKECGAFMTNIMQLIPVKESIFANMPLVSNIELNEMRKKCEGTIKQMYHCKQCRADAIGTLAHDCSIDFRNLGCSSGECTGSCKTIVKEQAAGNKTISSGEKYKFAVATKTGLNIDQHFGHAEEFYIYEYSDGNIKFSEKREIKRYCAGKDECDDNEDRIEKIIKMIEDCDAVITLRVGLEPAKKLQAKNIKVFQMYDEINKGILNAVKQITQEKDKTVVGK